MSIDPHSLRPPEASLDTFTISWQAGPMVEPALIALQGGLAAAAFVMLTPIAARSAIAIRDPQAFRRTPELREPDMDKTG